MHFMVVSWLFPHTSFILCCLPNAISVVVIILTNFNVHSVYLTSVKPEDAGLLIMPKRKVSDATIGRFN